MTIYKRAVFLLYILLGAAIHVLGQNCTLTVSLTASNNGVICSGNSIILTATPSAGTPSYTYSWSTGETTAAISVNKGGTYTVSVSDQTDGCQPVTQSITVTESSAPNAPSVADQVVCQNSRATLTATAPGGSYQWYDTPVGGTPLATGDSFTTPPITTATTYYVETVLNGCTGPRAAVNVTLSGTPVVSGASICAGNQAVLHASGGDSYTWYETPGGTPVGTGPDFTTPALTTTTTYYVVSVANGCASGAIPVTASVTPYPQAPTVSSNLAICAGGTVNLHADANGVIDWFDVPSGGTSLITSPDYTTPVLTATTTYYVQNSANGCVSQRTPVTITVNAIPDAPVVQPATICAGTSTVLTPAPLAGGTYNWYGDAAGTNLLFSGNSYQTPVLNNTTTYYVQNINGTCSSPLTSVTVNVTPSPPAPTATVTPVCPGTPATFTATNPGGSYDWYDVATGGTPLASNTTTFTTPPLTSNTTYYLQTTINGCTSSRSAITATVLPPATPPTAPGVTVCSGSPASIIASGSDNYLWYDAPVGGNLLTAGQVYVTDPLTATTTYYVETTVNGCTSTRTAVTATVNPVPDQPVANGPYNICPGNTATLTASVPAGGTINWYDAATGGNPVGTGNSFTTPILYDTETFYADNTVGECVSPRTAVTVNAAPIVYPQFQYSSGTFCTTGPHATPTIADPTGGTFTATPAGLVFVDTHTGEINVGGSVPGVYMVTFVGNESCHASTTTQIAVLTTLNAHFTYNGPYCQYGPVNPGPTYPVGAAGGIFTATPTGLVFLDNTSGVIDLKKSKAGTYTVTNTIPADGTCLENQSTGTVTISPGVTTYAGPDQTVKAGSPVRLAGQIVGVPGGKWTGGAGTFSDATKTNAVYTPAAGETSVTLTLTSDNPPGNCGGKSDKVVITIVPAPTAPTAAGATTCVGSSVTLSATAPGGTYKWYSTPTGGTALHTGANFTTPILTASTVYYVETTISVNTSNRTAVNVTVNTVPVAPTAITPVPTCYNTPATLTASGSTGSYEWYDAPIGGSKQWTGSSFTTPSLSVNTSYYVQAVNNGCAGPRTKVDVTITHAPVITSSASATICSKSALNYDITSDVPTAVYTWERPQVAGISNPAVVSHTSGNINETLINTGNTPVNVTYNFTASANGCTTAFQYIVTVNPTPTVTSAPAVTICNESPLNYTITLDDPGANFNWSRAAVPGISNLAVTGQAAATIREILHNTTNAPVDVIYTIAYSRGDCTGTFNFTVTVNPYVYMTSVNTATVCTGNPFNYQITDNTSTATFNWSRAADPNISNPAVSNQTTSTISETLINTSTVPVNVNYYIQPTAFGCQGPIVGLIVTVYPTPPTPVANSNSPVCVGSTIRLQTPVVPNASYLWTGPNGFTSPAQNPEIDNATAANAGTYSLVLTINGCPGPPNTTDVKVNSPAIVTTGPDQTVCPTANTVSLTGNVTGGTKTGIWTSSGSGFFSPSNAVLSPQYTPSAQDKTNGSVLLTLSSTSKDDCAIATASTNITFFATPAVDAGSDQEVCSQSNQIQLAGRLLKPGTAFWSKSGTGSFSPSAAQLNAIYIPSAGDIKNGSVTLTLNYNNAGTCDIATDDVIIKFIPPPTVNAGGTRYVLKGHTITLEPTVSDNNVQYLWTPNIGISNNTIKNPVITGGDADITYTLTVTDSRGCISQDSILIKVSPEININNAFTPNSDGINDYWVINGLVAYETAVVDVFDRYGARVYHSIGYDKAWDGNYNGKQLPTGTYYYVIKLNVKGQILSGNVTIIR